MVVVIVVVVALVSSGGVSVGVAHCPQGALYGALPSRRGCPLPGRGLLGPALREEVRPKSTASSKRAVLLVMTASSTTADNLR